MDLLRHRQWMSEVNPERSGKAPIIVTLKVSQRLSLEQNPLVIAHLEKSLIARDQRQKAHKSRDRRRHSHMI